MVSTFIKAGILTALILGSWLLFSLTFEGQRNNELLSDIDTIIAEESATQSYLDYIQSTGNIRRFCTVLGSHIQSQNENLFGLLQSLDAAKKNSLDNQYELVRKRFQAANAQLYFSLLSFQRQCPFTEELQQPVLYFFSDLEECSNCAFQAQILDELGNTCGKSIQIFAFPYEGGIEPIDLLVSDLNITQVPTLVIDENKYVGIQAPSKLANVLGCEVKTDKNSA